MHAESYTLRLTVQIKQNLIPERRAAPPRIPPPARTRGATTPHTPCEPRPALAGRSGVGGRGRCGWGGTHRLRRGPGERQTPWGKVLLNLYRRPYIA